MTRKSSNKHAHKRKNDGNIVKLPKVADIVGYLAEVNQSSPNLQQFLSRSLSRLESIGGELGMAFLSVYCSTMKSYIAKHFNNVSVKTEDTGIEKTGGLIMEGRPTNKALEKKEPGISIAGNSIRNGNLNVDLQMISRHGPPIIAHPTTSSRGAAVMDVDEIEREMFLKAKRDNFVMPAPALKQPTNLFTPSPDPNSMQMRSSSRPGGLKIQFKEAIIEENENGRDTQGRTTVHPNAAARRSSSLYQFRREEQAGLGGGSKNVKFSEIDAPKVGGPRSKNVTSRHGASAMNKSPMTRGRSQSVKHNKQTNVATVKQRNDPIPENSKFMMIRDLRDSYDVHYITDLDSNFSEAIDVLTSAQIVGFDAEYRMEVVKGRNMQAPSYLQFGLIEKCYVFNMNMLGHKRPALEVIWDICASDSLLKVGHSVVEDLERVFGYYKAKYGIQKIVGFNTADISKCFYTVIPPQRFSLADLTHRYLGKYLRKNEKSISAGGKFDLTNELQMEYVSLDALVPIYIYLKFAELIDKPIKPTPMLSSTCLEPTFIIEWSLCSTLVRALTKKNYGTIISLPRFTHEETIAYFLQNPAQVLVTHDKYFLTEPNIRNKIPYFDVETTLNAMQLVGDLCSSRTSRRQPEMIDLEESGSEGFEWEDVSSGEKIEEENGPGNGGDGPGELGEGFYRSYHRDERAAFDPRFYRR